MAVEMWQESEEHSVGLFHHIAQEKQLLWHSGAA